MLYIRIKQTDKLPIIIMNYIILFVRNLVSPYLIWMLLMEFVIFRNYKNLKNGICIFLMRLHAYGCIVIIDDILSYLMILSEGKKTDFFP